MLKDLSYSKKRIAHKVGSRQGVCYDLTFDIKAWFKITYQLIYTKKYKKNSF